MSSPEAASRRAARKSWPVRRYRRGEEPRDNLSEVTSAEERLEMVAALTLEAWRLAGLPIPAYRRRDMPVRVLRRAPRDALGAP